MKNAQPMETSMVRSGNEKVIVPLFKKGLFSIYGLNKITTAKYCRNTNSESGEGNSSEEADKDTRKCKGCGLGFFKTHNNIINNKTFQK